MAGATASLSRFSMGYRVQEERDKYPEVTIKPKETPSTAFPTVMPSTAPSAAAAAAAATPIVEPTFKSQSFLSTYGVHETPVVPIGSTRSATKYRDPNFTEFRREDLAVISEDAHLNWGSNMKRFQPSKRMTLKSEDAEKGYGPEPRPPRPDGFYETGLGGFDESTFKEKKVRSRDPSRANYMPLREGFTHKPDSAD